MNGEDEEVQVPPVSVLPQEKPVAGSAREPDKTRFQNSPFVKLKDENLDLRVSSNGKAELLLGYLANPKESEKQESASI